jgi:hypothetical protein
MHARSFKSSIVKAARGETDSAPCRLLISQMSLSCVGAAAGMPHICRRASVFSFASTSSGVGEYAGNSNIWPRSHRICATISTKTSRCVSLGYMERRRKERFFRSSSDGSSVAKLWQKDNLMKDPTSSINGNLKRALREDEVRNGGCKLSKRDEKNKSSEEIRLEQPGSMRLAREMESEVADQVERTVLRVFKENGKLVFVRQEAENYKVIDVKKHVSKIMNYDPSELRLSWGETNLEDDVFLSSLGRALDLRVAVVIARSHDIARRVQVASIGDPGECLAGAAIERLSAIIEPVSADSVEDIKSLARSLADRALSVETRHFEYYISLFQTLSNRWYRSTGALSERHVVKSLLDHTQDEWERVLSALVDADCWIPPPSSSPLMKERLMALTKFIGVLFRYKWLHMGQIAAILHDLEQLRSSCDARACACELLQDVCAPSNCELGRLVLREMWYGTSIDEIFNLLRSPN